MAVLGFPGPAKAPPPPPQAFFALVPSPPEAKPGAIEAAADIPAEPAITEPDEREMRCLAATVYWEAGMEPRDGQLAVAHVVLNRLGRPGFASTICGVVTQGGRHFPCQFHWYCSGRDTTPRDPHWWDQAQRVAHQAIRESRDPSGGALFFQQVALKRAGPAKRYARARVIGHHIFFGPA